MVGALRNRFSDWDWSMYGAAAGGHVDQRPHAAAPTPCGNSSRISAGSSAMSCTEPVGALDLVADLRRPQAPRLQLAHQIGVDLEELARQGLALEQVGHLRLDALVAAGDRGDGGRRGDGDQQRVAQAVRGDPRRAAPPSAPSGGLDAPQVRAAGHPAAARVSAYAGCAPCSLGQLARGLQGGQEDLLVRSGSTARRPRASRTAGAARTTRPAGPSAPSPTGRQRGFDAAACLGRVEVDVDHPVEEHAPPSARVARSRRPSRRPSPGPRCAPRLIEPRLHTAVSVVAR